MASPKTVQSPPKEQKSLSEIFNGYANETTGLFPGLKGRLLIMDMSEQRLYGSFDLDEAATHLTQETALTYINHSPTTYELLKDKTRTSCALYDAARDLHIIFINDLFDQTLPEEKLLRRMLHLLDHELGHLAIPDGYYYKNDTPEELMGECIADAYALIRHYQRYGTEVECADKYVSPFSRAQSLIFDGNGSHFSTFVLDEIIRRRNAIDFEALSPQQTTDAAWQFAKLYAPSLEKVGELIEEFSSVKEAWEKNHTAGVQALIDKTLETDDYAVFRTGNAYLRKVIQGPVTFKDDPPQFSREYLKEVSKKLQEREFHFAHADMPKLRATPKEWRALGLAL